MITRRLPRRPSALRNPSNYVEISRDDLEEWLDSLGFTGEQKWLRDPKFAGVYLLPLSQHVAIRLSSTIGSSDSGVGVGEGSMKVSLVALQAPNAVALNKRAVVGSTGKIKHFHRTTNWRKNWVEGIDVLRAEYGGGKRSFYDRIARERAGGEPPRRPEVASPAPSRALAAPMAAAAPAAPRSAASAALDEAYKNDPRRKALVALYARAKTVGDEGGMGFAQRLAVQIRDGVTMTSLDHEGVGKAMFYYGIPYEFPTDREYNEAVGPLPRQNPSRRRGRAVAGGRW